jgi:PIN domain
MMIKAVLDTSFLIRLFQSSHAEHCIALDLWTRCLSQGTEIIIPTLVMAEYNQCLLCAAGENKSSHACPNLRAAILSSTGTVSPNYMPFDSQAADSQAAEKAASLNFLALKRRIKDIILPEKASMKVDVMILATAMRLQADFVIGADAPLVRFAADLSSLGHSGLPMVLDIRNADDRATLNSAAILNSVH